MRARALALIDRSLDDMTDAELMQRAADEFWFIELCIDSLHRLPSEVEPVLTCREHTALHAFAIVRRAMDEMTRRWRGASAPTI